MKIILIPFLFSLSLLFTVQLFAQTDFGDIPCDYYNIETKDSIEEDIEFFVSYTSYIDLTNENCSYSLAEDYYNIAPDMQTDVICVIYINQKEIDHSLRYITLFDNPKVLEKYINQIQLVFICDRRTELWKTYEKREEIEHLFTLDIRKGIPKE